MAKLMMYPKKKVYIASGTPEQNQRPQNWLFAGQDGDSLYRSLLEFDLGHMIDNMDVKKAVLRIYSGRGGQRRNTAVVTPYFISSQWEGTEVNWNNQPSTNQSIRGVPVRIMPGWNSLDITPLAQAWGNAENENFGVLIKSQENQEGVAGFSIQENRTMPVLELFYEDPDLLSPEGCFFQDYRVFHRMGYSHWKQSCDHTMYTFFVQNIGNSDVEAFVQISPDQRAVVDENAVFKIVPCQTEAIVPQTFAFYTRLAFRTVVPHSKSAVRIWFQPVIETDNPSRSN